VKFELMIDGDSNTITWEVDSDLAYAWAEREGLPEDEDVRAAITAGVVAAIEDYLANIEEVKSAS
jgi:hypothetical protein